MARIITVTSGKGGVGKTSISVNTAVTLAAMGKRVCLFDADLGLANVNILLGIYPQYDLSDVIAGERSVTDIIIRDCHGIDIIPGSTGVAQLADLGSHEIETLIAKFSGLTGYDFVIVDTSAGISKSVISFCMASVETVLVLTPEPTSMTDGYSLLKVLAMNRYPHPVMVAVNLCAKVKVARIVFERFQETVRKFLPIRLLLLGPVVKDPAVSRSVLEQKPFVSLFPGSLSAKCIRRIGELLVRKRSSGDRSFDRFLLKCMDALKGAVDLPGRGSGRFPKKRVDEKAHEKAGETGALPVKPQASLPETDTGVQETLKKLDDKVSALSSEISRMGKILENLALKLPVPELPEIETASCDTMEIGDEPLRIALDFEAYVRERKTDNPQKTME